MDFDGLNAIADASFRFESLLRTISRGMPGFTSAALMYSVPRSIPRTADAAEAVLEKRNRRPRRRERVDIGRNVRRRPGGAMMCVERRRRSLSFCSKWSYLRMRSEPLLKSFKDLLMLVLITASMAEW